MEYNAHRFGHSTVRNTGDNTMDYIQPYSHKFIQGNKEHGLQNGSNEVQGTKYASTPVPHVTQVQHTGFSQQQATGAAYLRNSPDQDSWTAMNQELWSQLDPDSQVCRTGSAKLSTPPPSAGASSKSSGSTVSKEFTPSGSMIFNAISIGQGAAGLATHAMAKDISMPAFQSTQPIPNGSSRLQPSPQPPFSAKTTPVPQRSRQSTPQPAPQRSGRRHYRTATPEQRFIREKMQGKPVYTIGMGPQNDRSLLYDFFEHIKQWVLNYTVNMKTLTAEQFHELHIHAAILKNYKNSSRIEALLNEQSGLIALVAGIVNRHMVKHALGDHALHESGHPQANQCENLAFHWDLLAADNIDAKHNLLALQQQTYAAIKSEPTHKAWRTQCAERFTNTMLTKLDGLLARNLPPEVAVERKHRLSELYTQGYRIGFRLRMDAAKWQFHWPPAGAIFDKSLMVNENRFMYGNVMRTIAEMDKNPLAHQVELAVTPTITKTEFTGGVERREVMHHSVVHIMFIAHV